MTDKKILHVDTCNTVWKSELILIQGKLNDVGIKMMTKEREKEIQKQMTESIRIFIEHDRKEIIENVIKSANIPDNLKVLVVDSVPSNIGEIADLNGYIADRLYFKKICKDINEKDIVEPTIQINPFNKFVRQRKKGKVKRW